MKNTIRVHHNGGKAARSTQAKTARLDTDPNLWLCSELIALASRPDVDDELVSMILTMTPMEMLELVRAFREDREIDFDNLADCLEPIAFRRLNISTINYLN
jgi:hypothetical protein